MSRLSSFQEKSIEATSLGISLIETLEKYSPIIINEALTRKFEDDMENIQSGKTTGKKVIEKATATLTEILGKFKKDELAIGEALKSSYIDMKQGQKEVGDCPECNDKLRIIKAKASGKRFVGCSNYPKCTYSMPLPQTGSIKTTNAKCPTCNAPIVSVIKKGSKPWRLCININCPSKKPKTPPTPNKDPQASK